LKSYNGIVILHLFDSQIRPGVPFDHRQVDRPRNIHEEMHRRALRRQRRFRRRD
jgi:hypothetical protein